MNQNNEAKLLLELFNSSRNNTQQQPQNTIQPQQPQQQQNIQQNITPSIATNNNTTNETTQEDLKFLRLANKVIQSSDLKSKIDPTIQTLLQRAQYFASPHGGLPINENLTYGSSDFNQDRYSTFPDLSLNEFKPKVKPDVKEESDEENDDDEEDEESQNNQEGKPFICSKCLLSFRRSSDLKRHEKTHLEVLPNVCKLCHKGFARKDALKRHIETLTCRRNRERLLQSLGINSNDDDKNIELDIILQRNGIN